MGKLMDRLQKQLKNPDTKKDAEDCIKIYNMDKINTTLEIPEGSKATIQGKVIDGKNYLVVEMEQEPELKEGDLAIFWDYTPREAIIAVYRGVEDGRYFDHLDFYWDNALKWDGTKEQYEKVLRGELK